MAGPDRPPEEVIRAWLEEHGSATVTMVAIEQSWDIERLDAGDRRRIGRALETAGISVEPPLTRVSREEQLTLSLEARASEPEPAPAVAEDSARPRVAKLGIAAIAIGLMVIGSLGPWAKNVFVTDNGLERDGALVIAAAAVAALVLAAHASRGRPGRLPILAAGLGAVAIGLLASDLRDIVDDTFVEPAWGLYAAAAGSVLLVALSMSLLVRRG